MSLVLQKKIYQVYKISHKPKASFDSVRLKKSVKNCLQKLKPVNSSLSTSLFALRSDKAQEALSNQNYEFDKSIDEELAKLHNKITDNLSTKQGTSLFTQNSVAADSDFLVNPRRNKIKFSRDIKPGKNLCQLRANTPKINGYKSNSKYLNPKQQYKKPDYGKPVRANVEILDKIINDCVTEKKKKVKIFIDVLGDWVGAKTFSEGEVIDQKFSSDYEAKNDYKTQRTLLKKSNKKIWKQNHYGFIDQIDKKLYSIRGIS